VSTRINQHTDGAAECRLLHLSGNSWISLAGTSVLYLFAPNVIVAVGRGLCEPPAIRRGCSLRVARSSTLEPFREPVVGRAAIIWGTVIQAAYTLFVVQSNRARQLMTEFFDKLRVDRKLDEALCFPPTNHQGQQE
jgi:hypothetical protein